MATPAERIDDLDLHLNTSKNPLDFLAGQELKLQPEPSSGIRDFSEVPQKPTEIGIDPAPILSKESGVTIQESAELGKGGEEIFPLPKSLVDYINSLSEKSAKKSLLHSMEKMPKSAVKRALSKHYAQHYITEQEYNTAFDLLEGLNRNEGELDTSGLIWPPPEEDVDGVEAIDLWALRGTQPTVDEAKKENKDAAVLEPAPPVDVSTASETKVIEENIPVPPEVLDNAEAGDITAESFGDLYEKLKQTGGVESTDNLTVEEWIEEIERVRYHPHPELLQEEITTNKGLRNLVFDLITKESATVSINDKHEYQIKDALEREDFELARKEAGEVDDEPRRNKLFELIDEKEKRDEHSDPVEVVVAPHVDTLEQNNELVSGEVKETAEVVKINLDIARENYARAKIEFSKKNTKYNKIKGSLEGLLSGGILSGRSKDKSPTEIELEEAQANLNEVMSVYIKEKATRKDEIIKAFDIEAKEKEKSGVPLTPEEKRDIIGQIKIKLLEQAEKEWDLLQGKMAELSLPEGEKVNKIKEVMAKGLKVWSKVPLSARLLLAPILIGTGVGLTAGLGAGALYAGTRLGRGLGGMAGSRIAGSLYDKRVDRINTEANEKIVSGYTDENSGKSFEEREMDYMNSKEEEAKRKKAQQIKKAMLMVGAGAGAGILTGLAESALSSGGTVSAASSVEATNKPKTGSFDGVVRPKSNISSVAESVPNKQESVVPEIVNKPENIIIPEAIKTPTSISATVELSSKGFLQDIHNLKANIIKQYGDNIPPEIKTNIIDKPTVEIAKEYGLYKPGSVNESAVGYAGEKLSLDGNGKLIIERLDGTKETLSGIGRESVKVAVPEVDTNTPSVPTPEKLADVPVDTEVIQTKILEADSRMAPIEQAMVPEEPEIMPVVDTSRPENLINQIEHKGSLVDVVAEGEGRVVKIGDQIIGHDKVFGDSKILVLDDKFQDGAKNKDIREAFAVAFEKSAKVDQIGPNPTAVDFEGGKIYIIQGLKNDPMGMKVLLNGKEIASGSMEVRGSALGPKLKFDSSLKGGWFLDDNAYERAFKNVKKFLQIK